GRVGSWTASGPPVGATGPPGSPGVTGRAKAVQQPQRRITAAAFLDPQTCRHSRSLPSHPPEPGRPARAPWVGSVIWKVVLPEVPSGSSIPPGGPPKGTFEVVKAGEGRNHGSEGRRNAAKFIEDSWGGK